MSNFAFGTAHHLVILAHNRNAPTDPEWDPYVEYVRQNKVTRALVVTEGGAPTAPQRQALTVFTPAEARVALLTGSAFARGVMTALAWFRPTVYRAFPPQNLDDALDYLEIAKNFAPDVTRKVTELQALVRIV